MHAHSSITFTTRRGALILGLIILAVLAGCGAPGDPGVTYLAIDWSSSPQALYFPAFPDTIVAGQYVQHSAGTYEGEYVAWDGSYWQADYWIEVEEGGPAPLIGTGDHGDEYYLSLWLYSFGPSIFTDAIVTRSVSDASSGSEQQLTTIQTNGTVPQAILDARLAAASQEPVLVQESEVRGRYRITIEARGWGVSE